MKQLTLSLIAFFLINSVSSQQKLSLTGQFESNSQYYFNDIDQNIRDRQIASNNYLDLIFRYGDFEAGVVGESYLPNPLLGFPVAYDETNLTKGYLAYKRSRWEVTLGDYYEQFGSGLVYRSYRQREIGVDQSTFGARLAIYPTDFIRLKFIYGVPNFYFSMLDSKLYGADGEIDLISDAWGMTLGFSAVLKQEEFTSKLTTQHNNSKLYSTRADIHLGSFDLKAEYAYKTPDANVENDYNRLKGQALQLAPSYSVKGFGVNFNFRAVQNMAVLHERELDANGNGRRDEDVLNYSMNYIPSISKIHSYNIYNIYTYQAKENNEIGYSGSIYYKIKRKSWLGGQYGAKLQLNSSLFFTQGAIDNYTNFLSFGEKLFSENGVQLEKKLSKKDKLIVQYTYQEYNKFLIEDDIEDRKLVKSHIFVADWLTKFDRKHSLRTELGYMNTKNDLGNWATLLFEYAYSGGLSIFVSDQYNFGTEKKHYYLLGGAYTYKNARVSLTYGETRDGYTCVGGVCKFLPGANALSLSVAIKI